MTLVEPIGEISAFLQYLDPLERKDAFAVGPLSFRDTARFVAANQIAAAAQQLCDSLDGETGPVAEGLVAPVRAVAKNCAVAKEKREETRLTGCKEAVASLEQHLADAARSAPAVKAGATNAKLPTVGFEAITKEARRHVGSFLEALGPRPLEEQFIAERERLSGYEELCNGGCDDLISACEQATGESIAMRAQGPSEFQPIADERLEHVKLQCKAIRAAKWYVARLEERCAKRPEPSDVGYRQSLVLDCAVACQRREPADPLPAAVKTLRAKMCNDCSDGATCIAAATLMFSRD